MTLPPRFRAGSLGTALESIRGFDDEPVAPTEADALDRKAEAEERAKWEKSLLASFVLPLSQAVDVARAASLALALRDQRIRDLEPLIKECNRLDKIVCASEAACERAGVSVEDAGGLVAAIQALAERAAR